MSLQISYDELRREIGRFLAYDRDPDEWTATETTDVADILKSGLRSFYWPQIGEKRYTWSFLRQSGTISTTAGTSNYLLASDFEGLLSGFSYSEGSQQRRISRVPEEEILGLIGKNQQYGAPEYCALRAAQQAEGVASRWEALFYPTPDATYSLTYRYCLSPPELSSIKPYHLGGAAHSECVLEACLAAAEKTIRPEHGPGVHTARFQQVLQASVSIDGEMQ